jgi:hypothetical protein
MKLKAANSNYNRKRKNSPGSKTPQSSLPKNTCKGKSTTSSQKKKQKVAQLDANTTTKGTDTTKLKSILKKVRFNPNQNKKGPQEGSSKGK